MHHHFKGLVLAIDNNPGDAAASGPTASHVDVTHYPALPSYVVRLAKTQIPGVCGMQYKTKRDAVRLRH